MIIDPIIVYFRFRDWMSSSSALEVDDSSLQRVAHSTHRSLAQSQELSSSLDSPYEERTAISIVYDQQSLLSRGTSPEEIDNESVLPLNRSQNVDSAHRLPVFVYFLTAFAAHTLLGSYPVTIRYVQVIAVPGLPPFSIIAVAQGSCLVLALIGDLFFRRIRIADLANRRTLYFALAVVAVSI